MKEGHIFGLHRVLEPKGVLPQPAWKLDNNMDIVYDNEILINVKRLNIDSASFHQICEEYGRDEGMVAKRVMSLVNDRGKHHNPVTGSGGMLIGIVERIGSKLDGKIDLKPGDKIATLVSLSLTPLHLDEVKSVHLEVDQIDVEGKAILFESGAYAKIPDDMTEHLALSVLDVAGAPAQTNRLVKAGYNVLVIGCTGKSGLLCSQVAKDNVSESGMLIGMDIFDPPKKEIMELGIYDKYFASSATDAVNVYEHVKEFTEGKMCDVVINCVNVRDTEMASILSCKKHGVIYFFSMATNFTKAALGAEGISYDVDMMVGNGYAEGHAEFALDVLRKHKKLRKLFEDRYS
jgi:L-erythro-3,5-diaminohexanoate dehydrogenase